MYAEQTPPGAAKNPVIIQGQPGLTQFTTCGIGPIRGLWQMANTLYAVSGSSLYSVTSAGVSTIVGSGIKGIGTVSMADNGTQLCIVNGTQGYIYSGVGGFEPITDPNFNPSTVVTYFDGYFIFTWTGTNQWFISNLLDGTTFTALDFAAVESEPGNTVSIVNQQENLLIFAQKVIETWYDSGDVTFPFARYDGATIERGCIAPYSVVKQDNSVFFLGDDKIAYRLNGIIPVRISTHAIEQEWQKYSTMADAVAFSYTWNGHKFVYFEFPSANTVWGYDIATGLWAERISYASNGMSYGRWRANSYVSCYNKLLIGDNYSGVIGYLDPTVFTEYGNVMPAHLVGPVLNNNRKRMFMPLFELDMQKGVGVTTGQGSDPQVMMDYSDDGGNTFKNRQQWQSFGPIGQSTEQIRMRWRRLGQFRERSMRIIISDPVVRTIISNNVQLTEGTN